MTSGAQNSARCVCVCASLRAVFWKRCVCVRARAVPCARWLVRRQTYLHVNFAVFGTHVVVEAVRRVCLSPERSGSYFEQVRARNDPAGWLRSATTRPIPS